MHRVLKHRVLLLSILPGLFIGYLVQRGSQCLIICDIKCSLECKMLDSAVYIDGKTVFLSVALKCLAKVL